MYFGLELQQCPASVRKDREDEILPAEFEDGGTEDENDDEDENEAHRET